MGDEKGNIKTFVNPTRASTTNSYGEALAESDDTIYVLEGRVRIEDSAAA